MVRTAGDVHAPAVPRRQAGGRPRGRRDAVHRPPDGERGGEERLARVVPDSDIDGADAGARRWKLPGRLHRRANRDPCGRAERQLRRAGPRRALHVVPLHGAVRIAYDVTPLSHPRTGVGNYVLGALRGIAEASAGESDLVAFGPVSIRGRPLLERALNGVPAERRFLTVPFAHATRRAWSRLGRPPAERFVGRFDVLHFTDWMYPPQRAGVRATMIHDLGPLKYPEKLHPRTVRMHTANAHQARGCDIVFTNAEFTAEDIVETLGIPRARIRVAHPGVDPAFTREGERHDAGRPYAFTTATLDWRK
ncbi:MAG: glycosyltransferase family 4 protein, partial [Actinobacteria bacterium]